MLGYHAKINRKAVNRDEETLPFWFCRNSWCAECTAWEKSGMLSSTGILPMKILRSLSYKHSNPSKQGHLYVLKLNQHQWTKVSDEISFSWHVDQIPEINFQCAKFRALLPQCITVQSADCMSGIPNHGVLPVFLIVVCIGMARIDGISHTTTKSQIEQELSNYNQFNPLTITTLLIPSPG